MASASIKFKVMSYNVLCFDQINNQPAVQKEIIEKSNAVVIGLQELSTSRRLKNAGEIALASYPYKYWSNHKAYLGFASKYPLKNIISRDFRNQDPQDMREYGQTRAYMMASLEMNGKTITLINAHLCFLTQDIKFKQMRELFEVAQQYPYAVVMGDFNCFMTANNDMEYINMYKQFADKGYHLANCNGSITKTWTDKINPGSLSNFTYPTDNIIVSPKINLKKTYYDKRKLSHPNGYPMDHIPMIALISIK